jgi:Holliday junction resolvase RusA-like endonuclease
MPKQRLLIEVDGVPAPQGSKRHVGKGRMIESSKHLPLWRKRVTEAALGAMTEQPWDGALPALSMHIVFTLPRPKGHHRSVGGLRSPMLHGWAPQLHAAKPDLDKLLRAAGLSSVRGQGLHLPLRSSAGGEGNTWRTDRAVPDGGRMTGSRDHNVADAAPVRPHRHP